MAEVMNSLFGLTPESLMAQREKQSQQEALNFAQLQDPFARANYQIYQGAAGLGRQVGNLFGLEDPELQRVTQRQSMLQQAQPTDAKSWGALASQLMKSGDIQGAQEAYAKSQALTKAAVDAAKTQSEIDKNASEVTKNLRVPTPTDARTPQEKNAAAYALTKGVVNSPEYKTAFSDKFAELITPEGAKPTKSGVATDGTQRAVYSDGKTQFVFDNDPVTKTLVKVPYAGGISQLTSNSTIAPEIKMPPNIVDAVSAFDRSAAPEIEMLDSSKRIKTLINETAKSNNSQTWEAARTTMAKTIGQGKLSNEDIGRTGVDPRLVQGGLDWINKKIEGVPNADIQKQLYVLASVFENDATSRYDTKVMRTRAAAKEADYKGNVSTYFPTAAERNGARGSNVVDWSSLNK